MWIIAPLGLLVPLWLYIAARPRRQVHYRVEWDVPVEHTRWDTTGARTVLVRFRNTGTEPIQAITEPASSSMGFLLKDGPGGAGYRVIDTVLISSMPGTRAEVGSAGAVAMFWVVLHTDLHAGGEITMACLVGGPEPTPTLVPYSHANGLYRLHGDSLLERLRLALQRPAVILGVTGLVILAAVAIASMTEKTHSRVTLRSPSATLCGDVYFTSAKAAIFTAANGSVSQIPVARIKSVKPKEC